MDENLLLSLIENNAKMEVVDLAAALNETEENHHLCQFFEVRMFLWVSVNEPFSLASITIEAGLRPL